MPCNKRKKRKKAQPQPVLEERDSEEHMDAEDVVRDDLDAEDEVPADVDGAADGEVMDDGAALGYTYPEGAEGRVTTYRDYGNHRIAQDAKGRKFRQYRS